MLSRRTCLKLTGLALGTVLLRKAQAAGKSVTIAALQTMLDERPEEFFAAPFTFSWWVSGGKPGTRHDSLILHNDKTGLSGAGLTQVFDNGAIQELKRDGTVSRDQVIILLRGFFALYQNHPSTAGKNNQMADATVESWSLNYNDSLPLFERDFLQPIPGEYSVLHDRCVALQEKLPPSPLY